MAKELKDIIFSFLKAAEPICCCKKVQYGSQRGNYSCKAQRSRQEDCPRGISIPGSGGTCRAPCSSLNQSSFCGYCSYCVHGSMVMSPSRSLLNCKATARRAGGVFKEYTCCAPSSAVSC